VRNEIRYVLSLLFNILVGFLEIEIRKEKRKKSCKQEKKKSDYPYLPII
jgi:hypothetical protein